MLLFKTSGATLDSVVQNQKHAFDSKPKEWHEGEIILVSKNKSDCINGEAQIQYIMRLSEIRQAPREEIELYWPGNGDRWKNIANCYGAVAIPNFNVGDIIGENEYERRYRSIVTFGKLDELHENLIMTHLRNTGVL